MGRESIPERSWRVAGLAAIALLLAALFLFGDPLLRPDYAAQLWSDPDIAWQSYPAKALYQRALREGRVPLANPHVFAGMPFAGNPQAQVFYPGSLLFLGDLARGFVIAALLHVALAFTGTYLLARHALGARPEARPAAAFAACAYAFSGSISTQIQQTAILHTSAWIPLFFYGLLSGRLLMGTMATAGLLLSGHTQIATYALGLGAVAAILEAVRERSLASGARPLAAMAAGGALSAVMLVPAAELLSISMRGRGVARTFSDVASFQDWQLPLVWNPAAYASLHGERFWTYPFVGTFTLVLALAGIWSVRAPRARVVAELLLVIVLSRPLLSIFVAMTGGIGAFARFYLAHWSWLVAISQHLALTIALVPLGLSILLLAVWRERVFAWASLAFLALLLCLGPSAPAAGRLFDLPIVGDARGAVRFLHLWALGVSMVGAFGVAAALERAGTRVRYAPILAVLMAGAAVALRHRGTPAAIFAAAALTALGLFGLRFLPAPRRAGTGIAAYAPAAIVRVELLSFGTSASRVGDPELFRYADLDRVIPGRDRDARVLVLRSGPLGAYETAFAQNAGMVTGHDAALGYEPLALRNATRLANLASPMTSFDPRTGALRELHDMAVVASPGFVSPRSLAVLDLLRARYVVTSGADLLAPERLVPARVDGTEPARRPLPEAEAFALAIPSETTFVAEASPAPRTVAFGLGADPGAGNGAPASVEIELCGNRRSFDVTPGDAIAPREIEAPAGPEAKLVVHVAPRGSGQGFGWVLMTRPQVRVIDASRAAALASRLRLVASLTGAAIGLPRVAEIRVYENDGALPIVLAPHRITGSDEEQAIASPSFDPGSALAISGEPPRDLPPSTIGPAHREGENVDASYDARAPTTLLVTNAYFPGIVARVDGARVLARGADVLLTAVDVPAGRHTLSVRYEPLSYRLGLFVTLLTATGGLAASLARVAGAAGAR
ncbi:MAG: hypothetical protein U0166_14020 [Acidobacteriota bacterium]